MRHSETSKDFSKCDYIFMYISTFVSYLNVLQEIDVNDKITAHFMTNVLHLQVLFKYPS